MTDEEIIRAIKQIDGFQGMTVNERLFATNLMQEFKMVKKHDKDLARRILELLQVDKISIYKIVD